MAVPADLPIIEADERKVKQIIYNLLSNAVKFTPDGGRVQVRASRIDGEIHVDVQDTGIGIAPEDKARVFEEFRQVGRERSREGTGLGLTLTKRFVELHGGRIWFESSPGKGQHVLVHTSDRAARRGEGMSDLILIVEDNEKNMKLARDLLEYHGFAIATADNAEDGLVLARAKTPKLILMDIQLPGMDGVTALAQLRSDASTSRIPLSR